MLHKYLFLLLLGSSFLLLTLNSCKDKNDPCQDPRNPECENYDPCLDAQPVSASFHMYEENAFLQLEQLWVDYDTDTSITDRVRFVAQEKNALSYTWYIGTETQPRTGASILINFADSRTPKRIRLIVQKEPNLRCFPNDDGVDTVDRMLSFIERYDSINMPIVGTFRGISTKNPNQEIEVRIGYFFRGTYYTTFTGFNDCTAYVSGGDMSFRQYNPWEVDYRVFVSPGVLSERCNLFDVMCRMPDNSDSIYVQYKQWSKDSTLYHFRGIKIQ
ncbi:MAG: hypothetical protein MUE96_10710 [Bacteroidia bacterium]|jgi:hypothetical protein|nr:hypothetical protein [Bacteroidia bacterium]